MANSGGFTKVKKLERWANSRDKPQNQQLILAIYKYPN
jgi:hypothetical protein